MLPHIRLSGVVSVLLLFVPALLMAQDPVSSRPAAASQPAEEEETELERAVKALSQPMPQEMEGKRRSRRAYEISGFLSFSYRLRTKGGTDDQDLYGYLSVNGGDARRDDVTFHVLGRGTLDLNELPGGDEWTPFVSLNDVSGDSVDLRLYEAWVDLQNDLAPEALGIRRIRLGRQNVHAGYDYLVDGIRVDFESIKSLGYMRISIYGGSPQLFYESSRSGDWLAGIDASFHPFRNTRALLRYAHVAENDIPIGQGDQSDDYASIAVRQGVNENLFVTGEWNTVNAETRDVRLRLDWDFPDQDLSIMASYRFQDSIKKQFVTELDPYFAVLQDSFAYHQVDVLISKAFGKRFAGDLGFTSRQLDDEGNEGAFNREYIRAWVTFSSTRWPAENLDLSFTGDYWDGDDDDAFSLGAELTWHVNDELDLDLGTYYSLYKYDLAVVDEREDATTFYLKARWRFAEGFRFDGRYEYETGDEGEFHLLWLGLTWTF